LTWLQFPSRVYYCPSFLNTAFSFSMLGLQTTMQEIRSGYPVRF